MAKPRKRKNTIDTRAAPMLKRLDRLSVKIVSLVANKVDRDGVLEAYEGIEAAREVRALMVAAFADFNRALKGWR